MTPRLKFAMIALFIILDACIVVYFFTDPFSSPPKQTAVQPPVSPQKPATQTTQKAVTPAPAPQRPSQPVAYQPPIQQQPQPTPEQIAKEECNRSAQWYRSEFNTTLKNKLHESLNRKPYDDIAASRAHQEWRNFRAQWNTVKSACHTRTLGQWHAPFGAETEDLPMKLDCDARGQNYGVWFARVQPMSPSQRNEYFLVNKANGGQTYEQIIATFGQLEARCMNEISGGWKAPFDKALIVRTSR